MNLLSLLISALKHRTEGLNAVLGWVLGVLGNIVATALCLLYLDDPLKQLKRRMRGRDKTVSVTGWRMGVKLGSVDVSNTPLSGPVAGSCTMTGVLTITPSAASRLVVTQPPSPDPLSVNGSQWVYGYASRRLEEAGRFAMASTMPRFPVALMSPPPPSGSFSTYGSFPPNSAPAQFH